MKCEVPWCSALPVAGLDVCQIHKQWPMLHSLERHAAWTKRVNRTKAAQKAAATKAVASDTKLQARGR